MTGENPYEPPQADCSVLSGASAEPLPVKTRWRLGPAMLLFMMGCSATLGGSGFSAAYAWQVLAMSIRYGRGPVFEDPSFCNAALGMVLGPLYLFAGIAYLLSARWLWKTRWRAFAIAVVCAVSIHALFGYLAVHTNLRPPGG